LLILYVQNLNEENISRFISLKYDLYPCSPIDCLIHQRGVTETDLRSAGLPTRSQVSHLPQWKRRIEFRCRAEICRRANKPRQSDALYARQIIVSVILGQTVRNQQEVQPIKVLLQGYRCQPHNRKHTVSTVGNFREY
jgi:hypothetical protein